VPGTREVETIGGPGRAVHVWLEPARLRERGVSVQALHGAIASANQAMPAGTVANPDATKGEPGMLSVQTGDFLQNEQDVGDIVVGVNQGRPVYLREVARVEAGAQLPQHYVWFTPGAAADPDQAAQAGQRYPAVTITVTKKPGENAVDVARGVRERLDNLQNTVIPDNVEVSITRDYGQTAADKANKLIQKLIFATGSVIILVGLALGRREAIIVGAAVILTLTATLFASWAWGFTLNRVSLFALIFSIGILVDDAIVVVENIHRHRGLTPDAPLAEIIPRAVDEVGGPTILATFTVIAALLPMAFVSGLMGPYMSPIPINASMGMAISLAIAFTVTPWLALKLTKTSGSHAHAHGPGKLNSALQRLFTRVLTPFLQSAKKRWLLLAGILVALMLSVGMTVVQWVVLKMLPFDNKSEYQVVLDMPAGTPLEDTAAALQDMSTWLATQKEVADVQGYAGTASPITFNGLVRQYYLRADAEGGDLQINLVAASERSEQSHAIAQRHRIELEKIAATHGARIKVVEVPPGPPVLSPIVAEIYGPDEQGRAELARRVAKAFGDTPDIVGIDTTLKEDAPRAFLRIQRQRAESLGIPAQVIAQTVHAALSGTNAAYLHDGQARYPVPVRLQLPRDAQVGLDSLLALPMQAAGGRMVPLSELVRVERGVTDQPRYTK
ncbi:MAG: multidrug transporter AcrB, partial [Comamonadaceae bacterium]|nr:multidrug transporter AcrB [Comamonadaceae bacterium]